MKIGVYSPNWIGDAVMALPFISGLKETFPQAEIIIICKDWVADMYENHPAASKIIPVSKDDIDGFSGTRKTGKSLQSENLDVFYTLTDSFRSAAIMWWSGAQKRIGFKSQMRSLLLTEAIEIPKKKMHRSQKYLCLLDPEKRTSDSPGIHLTENEKLWAKEELEKMGHENPVALFPFSVASSRSIPNSKIKEWLSGSSHLYFIFGSGADAERASVLINECPFLNLINLCGQYSMRESMALISRCQFALAADSGLGHIAGGLGIPTISLFGAGDSDITKPNGTQSGIIDKHVHCSPCRKNQCFNREDPLLCFKEISQKDINIAINFFELNP